MTDPEIERFEQYSTISPMDKQIEIARYMPIKQLCKDSRILDLGCGSGYSTNLIHSWGASSVVGVDIDTDSIRKARCTYANPGLEFIEGYAEQISELVDLHDFNGICFVECIEHVIEPVLVLNALKSVLSSDTWVYITAPNDDWNFRYESHDNPYHLRNFSKLEFLELTSSFLGSPIESGEGHAFLGFSTIPDELATNSEFLSESQTAIPNSKNHLNSNDASFFYSMWGGVRTSRSVVGNPAPMSIYTQLNDVGKLALSVADLSLFAEKKLVHKYQNTLEALIEARNQLSAVSILMESLKEGSRVDVLALSQFEKFENHQFKRNKFKKFLSAPPKIFLLAYQILPVFAKDFMRNLRRRLLR
jgi:SAM-dependent methyltransferase